MTEGQFAVIACWLGTIAILVGPAWTALGVFVGFAAAFIAYEMIAGYVGRWRRRRHVRRRDNAVVDLIAKQKAAR
jgi:hypothetical protein